MKSEDRLWARAQAHARRFLYRFEDSFTRAEREDLVQESTVAAWQWVDAVREPSRLPAAVRTIARRKRYQALREHYRRRHGAAVSVSCPASSRPDSWYLVAGRRVSHDWLLPRLRMALCGLSSKDRCILMAQQEGFCCAEIADRLDLEEQTVKVRMHRAKRRLRKEIERAVRMTGALEVL
jgi:RNA polymerase sigma factor (sigma-70 family)